MPTLAQPIPTANLSAGTIAQTLTHPPATWPVWVAELTVLERKAIPIFVRYGNTAYPLSRVRRILAVLESSVHTDGIDLFDAGTLLGDLARLLVAEGI